MLVGAVAGVALLVPVGFGITEAVDRWMPDPPAAQTVDRSPAALLLAMRDVADYHAASGTYQVLVDVEQDSPYLPSMISGERSTLFATGTVDGRVDFSGLGPDAIRVSDDRRSATITLPAPTLTPATLDPAQTRIVGRERGLVQRVEDAVSDNPRDDSELYKLAAAKLDAAAAQSDLTTRAADNTRAMLTGLAQGLGYEAVTVNFAPGAGAPPPVGRPSTSASAFSARRRVLGPVDQRRSAATAPRRDAYAASSARTGASTRFSATSATDSRRRASARARRRRAPITASPRASSASSTPASSPPSSSTVGSGTIPTCGGSGSGSRSTVSA